MARCHGLTRVDADESVKTRSRAARESTERDGTIPSTIDESAPDSKNRKRPPIHRTSKYPYTVTSAKIAYGVDLKRIEDLFYTMPASFISPFTTNSTICPT